MAETSQEYGKRLQGYVAGKDPLKILRETPALLRRLIVRKAPKLLSRRPHPDKWSVREILAHLADDELVLAYRIRKVLEEPGRTIDGFDQARWASVLHYASDEPSRTLERFRQMREWNLELFRASRPRSGRSPESIPSAAGSPCATWRCSTRDTT